MSDTEPFVVLEWSSSSIVEPTGEPTDYVYEARGSLIDIDEDEDRTIIGRFGCYYMDVERALNDGMSAFEVFDAHASTIIFHDAIFDAQEGHYSAKLVKLCGDSPLSSNVLILDRLEILPKYRKRRLGLTAIRHMIQRFGAGAGLVALKPFPLQLEAGGLRDEKDKWRQQLNLEEFKGNAKAATKKLVTYYAQLGFKPLRGTAFMFRSNEAALPELDSD